MIAITRPPSAAIENCVLTHVSRTRIDVDRAKAQHAAYEEALRAAGADVVSVTPDELAPDACFVEDTAVVLDEVVVMAYPGAASRVAELGKVAAILGQYHRLEHVRPPATLDGGDVLRVGRTLYVGIARSERRTSIDGAEALRALAQPLGYTVRTVSFGDCLHLKTGVGYVGRETLLVNPDWVSPKAFDHLNCMVVDAAEPFGANALLVGEQVIMPASAACTAAQLRAHGFRVSMVDISELEKAEGGVTCLSLLVGQ